MRNRVERLRIWLLGSAIFLMLVIGAFIGTARYLRRLLLGGLPAKLGVNIESDASGWTYSQSRGSQTLYTIHAAKWEKRTDGKIVLHDVSILLYGPKGNRHDRIYGDEFEYDKDGGVVRATGVVHIDLETADAAEKSGQDDASNAKLMHVKTSGLVYLEKLGVAATSEYIEFQAAGMTGHATGADYSSDSGLLMLHSAVNMSGTAGGHPVNLAAATAEFNDQTQQAQMTRAKYDSQGRTAGADDVTLYRRTDGTLSRVEAHGNVTGEADGATMAAQRADVALTATSQPQTAVLTGGVRYSSDEPLRQMKGTSDAATITFDGQAKPQPSHALFTGAVHVTERARATDGTKEPWSTRDVTAGRLDVALGPGAKGQTQAQVRDVAATGSPRLTLVSNGANGTSELSADDLSAHLIASADPKQSPQVDTIVGRGHTVLRQTKMDGVEQTTAGDTLDAKMRPRTAASAAKRVGAPTGQSFADTLSNAVQMGHVTMMRRSPAKPKAGTKAAAHEDLEQATAQRAVYDGDQDRVTLSGGVTMSDAGSGLWADQVALDHKTGDAHAIGGVKMNYVQDPALATRGGGQSDQPTHILADRAELQHETKVATFYGKPVRMWQGGNQVQAPVIEVAQAEKRLTARGEGSAAGQVHTVLTAGGSDVPGKAGAESQAVCSATAVRAGSAKAGAGSEAKSPEVVRVASGGLVYSDSLRQADFTDGFRADTVDGTIRAGAGTVYLQKKAANAGSDADTAVPSLGGNLDHVVAAGHVELEKPGMHATGERLVYTASDRIVLLTGDAKAPPKAVGAQGTTTGATLRFNSCDGSVEALGGAGERVLTDARISNEEKKEKGKR
jgi:lipopolysaccharide export system protein LptA